MDTGLWKKIQGMAAAGDRIVVVEDGEAYVLLPIGEYERIRNGEVSLVTLRPASSEPSHEIPMPEPVVTPIPDTRSVSMGPAGLWQSRLAPQPQVESFTIEDSELSLASDEAEGEERFYLEPVE